MWYENQGLAKKCTCIYSKNVIYNWYDMKTPAGYVLSCVWMQEKTYPVLPVLHVDAQTHSHSFKRTHLHILQPHVALHSSGDKKCSYINVSVMHTVGPNSYIIYKPNHHITTTRFSILNKDNMNVIQTHMIVFKCLNVILSRSSRRGR